MDFLTFELAKLIVKLDKLTEAIANLALPTNERIPNKNYCVSKNIPGSLLPIDCKEKLEQLDTFLKNSNVMNIFVEDMSRYSGKSGILTGKKIALNMLDQWFTRDQWYNYYRD